MKRRKFLGLSTTAMAGAMFTQSSVIQMCFGANSLNANTKWLLEAKYGLFSHLLPGEDMTTNMWNKKVSAFKVSELADQLEKLKVPYFFITVGDSEQFFCSPNSTYRKQFPLGKGAFSDRDLIADLAEELIPRGIKLCVSLPALGGAGSPDTQEMYQKVITEWSKRWGKSISAWWIDDGQLPNPNAYAAYTKAFKAGNNDALIAYNSGPIVMTYNLKKPPTEEEDFFAGEVDWLLPTSAVRAFDKREFWVGPDFYGDQLHFLTFLGSNWGTGDPRFPTDLVKGWTRHTNNYSGTVTWDVPLTDSGLIPWKHFNQLAALGKYIAG